MMIKELAATVWDAMLYGNWRGHLQAWWGVVRCEVDLETRRYVPGKLAASHID